MSRFHAVQGAPFRNGDRRECRARRGGRHVPVAYVHLTAVAVIGCDAGGGGTRRFFADNEPTEPERPTGAEGGG